jgi:two-component system OmpR family sensor kinase
VSRVPVRARLTGAFALAMVVVLAGAAWFVRERVESHLDESIDNTLRARADAGPTPERVVEDPEEEFVQVVAPGGLVLRASGGARGPALRSSEVARVARDRTLTLERDVPGIEGRARLLARRAGRNVVVAGQLCMFSPSTRVSRCSRIRAEPIL